MDLRGLIMWRCDATTTYEKVHHVRWQKVPGAEADQIFCTWSTWPSLPTEDGININKLGQLGIITIDTCNNAQKQRQLLSLEIQGNVIEQDCHHHLPNVWAKAVKIELSKYLTVMLRDSLDRVSAMFTPLARAYDKEFSLAANYPKGHGELFAKWMKENYPSELLFYVEGTHGSRQDIMFTAALAIAMNWSFNIEFIDYCFWMSDKKKHISQKLWGIKQWC